MVADLLLVVPVSSGLALEHLILLVHTEEVLAAVLRVGRQDPGLTGLGVLAHRSSRNLGPGQPHRRQVPGAELVATAEIRTSDIKELISL